MVGGNFMIMITSEKIRFLLIKRKMSSTDLANATGQSRQNLANKLKRNNFSIEDLQKIAIALNCSFECNFITNDTGEKI